MPLYPGAPWLITFKGPGDDLKFKDWKEQIQVLLSFQELTEAEKADIVLGALAGEAKSHVSVQGRRILLSGDRTPTPVLRSVLQLYTETKRNSALVYYG